MEGCRYYVVMILVQLAYGGSSVLVKLSLEEGLKPVVFVVYRHVMAMFLLAPFAYFLEKKQRPSISFSIAAKVFVLTLFGTTIHLNVYYTGLAYTSPTVACALSNVVPSLTFAMAVLLRMENLNIKSARGQAKVVGTLLCIGGSLMFTFWKGYLFQGFVEKPLISVYSTELKHGNENWIKGSGLILTSHIVWCSWLILQAVVCKVYPAPLSLTTLICFFASLQSSIVALFFARDQASWRLDSNVQLLTIAYSGFVSSALVYYLQTWCISYKGPVFTAMFSPLQVIIVALFSAFAFAERLHVGSLIGAFLIIVGLYCFLWGKKKDGLVAELTENEKGVLNDDKVLGISLNDIKVTNPVTIDPVTTERT
ncbi:putative EamA domain-containing protein [Rosa chinensis]|uniref:WAT1-related protein n=1 Tax=Rosa chinensis TaxID=74649 RepID=A0A2P6P4E3_ROSCH|nr:WAT1-related protein At5g07050 [Rosa chinensis]PRQ16786.1 putative EamA domain-containing protein [Rosa chinensis]